MNHSEDIKIQSGVLAYRFKEGQLQILLITSSSGNKWIIPKGKIEPGMTPEQSALNEAREEAGLKGKITGPVLGSYRFRKKKDDRVCRVDVFPMWVEKKKDKKWKEKKERKRKWLSIDEAMELVANPELKALLLAAVPQITTLPQPADE